jgi:carbon monoxide dehydrogenase subunit G
MRLEHSFTVPVPVGMAWDVLLDVARVAACMPGATLSGVDGDAFTGSVKVKVGPIALTYQGKGRFVERDEATHRVVMEASGKDVRSAGTAAATVTAVLTEAGDHTKVEVSTDLNVTGRPAQFGRGMIADVGAKLIGQFADCLANTLGAEAEPAPEPVVAEPAEHAAEPAGVDRAGVDQAGVDLAERFSGSAAEAEPIDLLRLGRGLAVTRQVEYGVAALVLVVVAWIVLRRLRR